MKLSITLISLCLVPVVWGQLLNHDSETVIAHSKAILDLQLRLSDVEHMRNEDALRIADLAKQREIDQRRIADLEKQQQIDRSRISDLVNKIEEDNRTIADFEKKRKVDQQRVAELAKKHQDDHKRIADLTKKQQDNHQRIADLEKQQQIDRSRISDLVNKIEEDNRTIADFEKKRKVDQQRVAELAKKHQDDHKRIADLTKKQQDNHQRIADIEKQHVFRRRIADVEKKLGVSNQSRLSNTQEQEHRRKMDSHYRFPLNLLTNSTAHMTNGRRTSSARDTNGFGSRPRNTVLPSQPSETSSQGIGKRVSHDNQGMVAFYAVLTKSINPVAELAEIHFDHVITNIGGSYSGNTGTFTCTRAGVYLFSWTVHIGSRYTYTELVKNGAMVGSAFSGDSPYSGIGGGTVVVQLDHADEVWVRVKVIFAGSSIYGEGHTTTFSGFLLR